MPATSDPAPAVPAKDPAPPQEWKPEPRQWTWKDLFTAPMLGFKPKCMLVSALTLLALGGWGWFCDHVVSKMDTADEGIWAALFTVVWVAISAVIFSLGASLVAVFMRADLLDDEFLTWSEALGQFRGRIAPALLVPLFLLGLLIGVNVALIWAPEAFCSIPYVGMLYGVFYPAFYFLAIFAVLLCIAVMLAVFVFPGIIAIRKHGWFDNVVDTIEAVGTKPHVLVASLILTLIMMHVANAIGVGAMDYLRIPQQNSMLFETKELPNTERAADSLTHSLLDEIDPLSRLHELGGRFLPPGTNFVLFFGHGPTAEHYHSYAANADAMDLTSKMPDASRYEADALPGYYRWGSGLVAGLWQTVLLCLLGGYCMNLLVGGGMLTYLLVREDDYWDDEDLEDLDKLAKELEEEAKRDEAGAAPAAAAPAAAPSPAPAPSPPANPQPPAAPPSAAS